ncbi:GNAT family N-acetyltransferase [Embleya sp. NPDC020886]|uniref:GNAT family N-acetyltransferase n=1 Tax=Embleya sp. NPDC020886 TaxID=3363980 RepID=UPI0037A27D98
MTIASDRDPTISTDLAHTRDLLFSYYNATADETGHPGWESPEQLPPWCRVDHDDPADFYAHPGAYFTALLDGRPAGGVGVHLLDADTAEVKRLYVLPHARGHGIAQALMARLHAHAHRVGARRVVLDCLPQRTGAINLYRTLGYRDIAPYREDHGPLPLACFELTLPTGPINPIDPIDPTTHGNPIG